jgi:hypothetical protein
MSFLGRRFQCTLGFSINTARLLFIEYRNAPDSEFLTPPHRRGPKKKIWFRKSQENLLAGFFCLLLLLSFLLSVSLTSATHSPGAGLPSTHPDILRNYQDSVIYKNVSPCPFCPPPPPSSRPPSPSSCRLVSHHHAPLQLSLHGTAACIHPPLGQALAVCRCHSASARARGSVAQITFSASEKGHYNRTHKG